MCDDFLLIARTQEEILQALDVLIHLLRKLGFSINYNKIVGPSQRLVLVGILFDSINMTIELPTEKIRELHSLLQDTLEKRKYPRNTCNRWLVNLVLRRTVYMGAVSTPDGYLMSLENSDANGTAQE